MAGPAANQLARGQYRHWRRFPLQTSQRKAICLSARTFRPLNLETHFLLFQSKKIKIKPKLKKMPSLHYVIFAFAAKSNK